VPAEEVAPWDKIGADTDDPTARLDTHRDTPSGGRQRRAPRTKADEAAQRRLYWVIGGAAVALLLIAGLVAWLLLRGKPDGKKNGARTGPLIVGEDAEFKTLNGALARARAGDEILIRLDAIRERVRIDENDSGRLKNITIRVDPPGHTVEWKPPEGNKLEAPLLFLGEVEGLRLKGFLLNGEGKVGYLVEMVCCKGVRLDRLELRNFRLSGVHFINCTATKKRPIVLSQVEANSAQPPLRFDVLRSYPTCPKNDNIQVEDDCRFSGAFTEIPMNGLKPGDHDGVSLPPALAPKKKFSLPPKK
jgi:hypothetical protein